MLLSSTNFDVPTAAAASKAATSPLITIIHLSITHSVINQILSKLVPLVAVLKTLLVCYPDFQRNTFRARRKSTIVVSFFLFVFHCCNITIDNKYQLIHYSSYTYSITFKIGSTRSSIEDASSVIPRFPAQYVSRSA